MNSYYNFDNYYNDYMYYSGGYPPSYEQYQHYMQSIYQKQLLQNYAHLQSPSTTLSPQPQPTINYIIKQIHSVCIKGMSCKNIKCTEYHHPSKDLDIIKASRQ